MLRSTIYSCTLLLHSRELQAIRTLMERKQLGAPFVTHRVSRWLWREGECEVGQRGLWSQMKAGSKVLFPTYWLTRAGNRFLSSVIAVSYSVEILPCQVLRGPTKKKIGQRVPRCGPGPAASAPHGILLVLQTTAPP